MTNKNGAPEFNFRKMGYRDEAKMSALRIRMAHLDKRIQASKPTDDIDALIEELSAVEEESLQLMVRVVTYLPEDYVIEGVDPESINYDNPEKVIDAMRFASMNLLAQDLAFARDTYKKK